MAILAGRGIFHLFFVPGILPDVVADKSFQRPDGDGFIKISSVTLFLAGMITNSPAYGWKRVRFPDKIIGFMKLSLGNKGNVSLGIYSRRTGNSTGRRTSFINSKSIGNCLRIKPVYGLPFYQTTLKLIGYFNRAGRSTITAAGTFLYVNIAGKFFYPHLEVPRFSLHFLNLCPGQNLYIGMPPGINQLGCQDTHSTIIGGKGLI